MSIYVSPTGSDTAAGTLLDPVQSFAKGVTLWKAAIPDATDDFGLYLQRGGVYNVTTKQSITDINNHPVTGKRLKIGAYGDGDRPCLTARDAVTDWSLSGSILSADLAALTSPAALQDVWCADGTELEMCSYGKDDSSSKVYSWGTVATTKKVRVLTSILPAVSSWSGVYLVVVMGWNLSRLRISSVLAVDSTYSDITLQSDDADIEFAKGDLTQAGPTYSLGMNFPFGPYHNSSGQRCWFENAPEFLTAPGMLYHDTADGKLKVYLPTGVTTATEFEAKGIYVSNGCETVLQINGSSEGSKIKNLDFEDIDVKHVGFNLTDDGYYVGYVAGSSLYKNGTSYGFRAMPSAIFIYNCESVAFRRSRFEDLGALGLASYWGLHGLEISQCAFHRLGASGLNIGAAPYPYFSDAPDDYQNIGLTLENNVAIGTGRKWVGSAISAGIWKGARIRHNTIKDGTDDGIAFSTGARCYGIWAGDTIVELNDIENVMTLVTDGGAIYSSGNLCGFKLGHAYHDRAFPGRPAIVRYNKIRNVYTSGYDPSGGESAVLYSDLGSEGNFYYRNDVENFDVFWHGNCERFNTIIDNKVVAGDGDGTVESIHYSGFNVVVDADGETTSTTSYMPPLNNPPNSTDLAKFAGTGDYSGRAFKDVIPFAAAADCFKTGTTDYESLSYRANNNADVVLGAADYGVDAETAEMYADLLI